MAFDTLAVLNENQLNTGRFFMIMSLLHLDLNLLLWIQDNLRTPFLTPLFVFITTLGNGGMLWILLSIGLMLPKKTRKTGLMCMAALCLSFFVNNLLLKNLVERMRPFDAYQTVIPLIAKPTDYSFPSGHTAASFACAGVLARYLPRRFGIPAVFLAALIAFSRLYLGVHYPSDVMAGMISGILVGYVAELFIGIIDDNMQHSRGIAV